MSALLQSAPSHSCPPCPWWACERPGSCPDSVDSSARSAVRPGACGVWSSTSCGRRGAGSPKWPRRRSPCPDQPPHSRSNVAQGSTTLGAPGSVTEATMKDIALCMLIKKKTLSELHTVLPHLQVGCPSSNDFFSPPLLPAPLLYKARLLTTSFH